LDSGVRGVIDGLGSHSGLGEEWADNENAGTSAEAQAFKRASSCFGLGRYLYDLDGNWVDLDERKQPLSRPRLPDWALPKRKTDPEAVTGDSNGIPPSFCDQAGRIGRRWLAEPIGHDQECSCAEEYPDE
jgi:hypothetical protein